MYRIWKYEGLVSKFYKLVLWSINDLNVIRLLIFFYELLKYIMKIKCDKRKLYLYV